MNNDLARCRVGLLALCQALGMTSNSVLFTTAALVGSNLAPDKTWATFPVALIQLATMATTIPASLLMQRRGRKLGFVLGALLGSVGLCVGVIAIQSTSFALFCLATVVFSGANTFLGFYRFAAAEVAPESFRSQAISLVIAGGVVAALLGPQLAAWGRNGIPDAPFAGSFMAAIGLQLAMLAVLSQIRIPVGPVIQKRGGRPLAQIVRQPVFWVAALGSMLGYGAMVLVMTATPLAMVQQDRFPFETAAFVIQWHLLGMFAPSFVTGSLIARFGVLRIILLGAVLCLACAAINLSGSSLGHYGSSLLLLGIGWNFLYVGSTTLLTEAYMPAEKSRTQACHDFLMYGGIAFSSLMSGQLFNGFGWQAVNLAGIPMVGVALFAALWLQWQRSPDAAAKAEP